MCRIYGAQLRSAHFGPRSDPWYFIYLQSREAECAKETFAKPFLPEAEDSRVGFCGTTVTRMIPAEPSKFHSAPRRTVLSQKLEPPQVLLRSVATLCATLYSKLLLKCKRQVDSCLTCKAIGCPGPNLRAPW